MVETILDAVDPRLREALRAEVAALRSRGPVAPLRPDARWVLAGHRAAGKTSLLRRLAPLCERPAVDLDEALAARAPAGLSIREWFAKDAGSFRAAERETFTELPTRVMVAVGGGFLSLHADLLADAEIILVPITFETYRERLSADASRPRLRPELSVDEELRVVFEERERAHRSVRCRPLSEALAVLTERAP